MLSDFAKIANPAVVAAIVTAAVAGVMFAVWVANRKRIAATTATDRKSTRLNSSHSSPSRMPSSA